MRNTRFLLIAALCAPSTLAVADDYEAGAIRIEHPWTRATPPGADVAGGYLVLENRGASDDRLTGGSSPAAARVEFHAMSVENGVMSMRQLADGLEVPAGKSVALTPGSLHVMLMGLANPLTKGERVPLTLNFEKSGTVQVELTVESLGARAPE